jgi:hypothetical protein
MNRATRALLEIFRKRGIMPNQSLTRVELLQDFQAYYLDEDDFDDGIEKLIDIMFIEAPDEKYGPYTLNEAGYDASLNFAD